ncbi:B-cell receptor CD22-like [Channa argus]|uniref:B-cell receptor CD22-like n=1 Tax=Channa argus TaxID=215402 RepID=UPI0035221062
MFLFYVPDPPKLPSVSVSPSAEIVEGSSVNLTCSSDANPAANYTWYKENEDSPKASGQIFTITDFRPEHSGNYYCEAQNTLGRQTSDLHFIGQPGISTAGVTAAVLLPFLLPLLILLCVYVWIRKRRVSKESSEPEERPDKGKQCLPDQGQTEEQDNLQYASVHFSEKQADAVYSNIRAAQPSRQEQEVTEYSPLRFIRDSTAPRFQSQDTEENPAALYSTINKT